MKLQARTNFDIARENLEQRAAAYKKEMEQLAGGGSDSDGKEEISSLLGRLGR